MPDERHFPGIDAEVPAAEAPAPEGDKAPEAEPTKPESEAATPEAGTEPAPETKPEDAKPEEPLAEPKLPKKRSIYDDLKDERTKRKDAEAELARLKSEAAPDKPADKPAEPSQPEKPADDLEQFAKDNDLDGPGLDKLIALVASRVPTSQLSDEDKQALADVRTWRAQQARIQEDQEVLATAPSVKTQLNISDDGELANVMKEVVRLSHTADYHDKEVEYIVWKNQTALAKLVSPKKPSFEQGSQRGDAPAEAPVDFSKGSVTPEMAGKAMNEKRGSSLEVRPSK